MPDIFPALSRTVSVLRHLAHGGTKSNSVPKKATSQCLQTVTCYSCKSKLKISRRWSYLWIVWLDQCHHKGPWMVEWGSRAGNMAALLLTQKMVGRWKDTTTSRSYTKCDRFSLEPSEGALLCRQLDLNLIRMIMDLWHREPHINKPVGEFLSHNCSKKLIPCPMILVQTSVFCFLEQIEASGVSLSNGWIKTVTSHNRWSWLGT